MRKLIDIRVATSGFVWAAVYNGVWAVAWFAFMRREWESAFDAIGQPRAWTAEVWFVWLVVTVPLGMAVMAYADGSPRKFVLAIRAALVPLIVFAFGMTLWGRGEGLSLRVMALDALVNAVAMPAASLAAAATLLQGAARVAPCERAI